MKKYKRCFTICLLMFAVLLYGCSNEQDQKLSRDNTPVILEPKASGTVTIGNDRITFDLSNSQEGYIMVKYQGDNDKVKVRITNPNEADPYNYDVYEGYNVYPLTGKSGLYQFTAYENIKDNRYSTLFSGEYTIELKNEYTAFLYPNQLVNFNANSKAVAIGKDVTKDAEDELDAVAKVYAYIVDTIAYDDDKADDVKQGKMNGYLSNVDATLENKKGICFDYAALMATMLRTQRIPTRMMFGYTTLDKKTFYHAWIGVYINEIGWIDNFIEFDGTSWSMMDPTLASENNNSSTIKDFISNKNNYQEKYMY